MSLRPATETAAYMRGRYGAEAEARVKEHVTENDRRRGRATDARVAAEYTAVIAYWLAVLDELARMPYQAHDDTQCTTPTTCGICHVCQRQQPCPHHRGGA